MQDSKKPRSRRGKPSSKGHSSSRSKPKDNRGKGRGRGKSAPRRPPGQQGGRSQGAPFKQKTIRLPQTFAVLFYKNLREAEADSAKIRALSAEVDQLNVVLEAEEQPAEYGFADAAELYGGAAWTLIHRRRVEDGWYDERGPKKPASSSHSHPSAEEGSAAEPEKPEP